MFSFCFVFYLISIRCQHPPPRYRLLFSIRPILILSKSRPYDSENCESNPMIYWSESQNPSFSSTRWGGFGFGFDFIVSDAPVLSGFQPGSIKKLRFSSFSSLGGKGSPISSAPY
jgi:hypothetical protein